MVKVLLGAVAGAMILAVAAPAVHAQCVGTTTFASVGGGANPNQMAILPGASEQGGNEFGRFWVCETSGEGNNFIPGDPQKKMQVPGQGGCASTDPGQTGGGWWQVTQTNKRGVQGFIDGPSCAPSSCPINTTDGWNLCVVVEDWDENGPPGIGGTAYFVGWRTDVTPANARAFDLSKFCGAQDTDSDCDVVFEEFPTPRVTSAVKNGTDRDLTTQSDTDPAINVYVNNPGGGPASGLIASYDLLVHEGPNDPGRDRNSGAWSPLGSLPYGDSALADTPVTVPCAGLDDAYIAFGLTFQGGGSGGPVPSQMVGPAIQIECGGNIADPTPSPKKGIRLDDRPGSRRTPSRTRGGR